MADPAATQEQDHEDSRLGDLVKVVVLIWSMAILTANYLGVFKQSLDPTFPASLLTGTMAAMGVNIRQKKKDEPKQPTAAK
ncbi:MAG: hypothetical protein CMF19_07435 [Idiomarinaceae bacterium]|nr:hypothetical protein [Idiomarinaceae bacterium]|tara:strand:+ start:1343 stop:1585 length:243 start_codon:yes stop_codon:yes gene_type:complete